MKIASFRLKTLMLNGRIFKYFSSKDSDDRL